MYYTILDIVCSKALFASEVSVEAILHLLDDACTGLVPVPSSQVIFPRWTSVPMQFPLRIEYSVTTIPVYV